MCVCLASKASLDIALSTLWNLSLNFTYHSNFNAFTLHIQVASWRSATADTGPPVIKWAPGSLMFATGSSELSFWIPDLSKLGAYVGRK